MERDIEIETIDTEMNEIEAGKYRNHCKGKTWEAKVS